MKVVSGVWNTSYTLFFGIKKLFPWFLWGNKWTLNPKTTVWLEDKKSVRLITLTYRSISVEMELLQKIITITLWLFEMFIWFTLRKSWVKTWNTWTKHHRNIKKYNQTGYPCHLAFLSGLSFNIYLFLLSIILHIITFLLQNFSTSKTPSFILSKLRHLHLYAHYFNRWVNAFHSN